MDTCEPLPHDVELGLEPDERDDVEVECMWCGQDIDGCKCDDGEEATH